MRKTEALNDSDLCACHRRFVCSADYQERQAGVCGVNHHACELLYRDTDIDRTGQCCGGARELGVDTGRKYCLHIAVVKNYRYHLCV